MWSISRQNFGFIILSVRSSVIYKDGEVLGTVWEFFPQQKLMIFMPKQMTNIGAVTATLNCEKWMTKLLSFVCRNTDLINTEYLSGAEIQDSSLVLQRGNWEDLFLQPLQSCHSQHCCHLSICSTCIRFKIIISYSYLLRGFRNLEYNHNGRKSLPCRCGFPFSQGNGSQSMVQQCHQTKLYCSKSYSRLKHKQGNRRSRSVLSKIILQVWSTGIFVGNTRILQSFQPQPLPVCSQVYWSWSGALLAALQGPRAQTHSWKSLSPVVHSHYCTCIFYFSHKRSEACQQAACLLRHTMPAEK